METKSEETSAALAVVPPRGGGALVPTNLEEAGRFAAALAKSNIIPASYQGQPGNILAAILMSQDLGISTMQAMREVYIVEGRPSTSALLKVALVIQSPLCEYWQLVESTDDHATFETKRKGNRAPTRMTYSLRDATTAGLYPPKKEGSNWAKRPKLMLRRRCESELADEVYPDIVKGLRTEDEAEEIEREVKGERIFAPETFAPPPPKQETKAEPVKEQPKKEEAPSAPEAKEPEPEKKETPPAPSGGAPDPAEVILAELAQATTSADVDALSRRAATAVPKGHPLRESLGKHFNEARARVKGGGR